MAFPILDPVSATSKIILPELGTTANVIGLPFGIYINDLYWSANQIAEYKSGSVDQIAFTYKKLGGDVLDLEITERQVHTAYEEACLEYSYMINSHQARNLLPFVLGQTTGTFDSSGQLTADSAVSSGSHPELKYPNMNFTMARQLSLGASTAAGFGGSQPIFSASVKAVVQEQDYDLQAAASKALSGTMYNDLADKQVIITKVYFKTIGAMWFFYGYFGGLNVVGNMHTYGQYADDSTFEIIPAWQNKLQAMMYEDNLRTRLSDYSYQIYNNKLRIFPQIRDSLSFTDIWFEFTVPLDSWQSDPGREGTKSPIDGVNNYNTIPLQNIPYDKINSMGKQWIRRYALALAKEMLGRVRSKFGSIPIPGESVTLDGTALLSEGKEEQKSLKDELKAYLDEMLYTKASETSAKLLEDAQKVNTYIPSLIFVG
jgi:hypothetical protein